MIGLKDKLVILFKGFFLQSVFNYERFQSIGFIFILSDFIKKIHNDKEAIKEVIQRHFEIFNTQPYMIGFVVGSVLRMEEEKKDEKDIINIKQALACAYASIGDRIFWSRLRVILAEFTFLIFIFLYWCCEKNYREIVFVSAFVPTLFYALYTIYIRYKGFEYSYFVDNGYALDSFMWNKLIKSLSMISFFLIIIIYFIAIFLYGFFYIKGGSKTEMIVYILLPFVAFFLQRYFRKNKKNIFYPVIAMVIISLVMAVLI